MKSGFISTSPGAVVRLALTGEPFAELATGKGRDDSPGRGRASVWAVKD